MWHDKTTNTLVYDVPDVERITKALPQAKHLYNGYVAVPVTLHALQMLRWLGLPVIPPMLGNYDWPRSLRIAPAPFKAQILTANFLVLHPHGLTLSDMGTGKTLSMLWAADFLMSHYPPGTFRFLVNAPLSTLQRTWGDALYKHLHNRRSFAILHGSADKRRELLAQPHDFYIVNHDGLKSGATVVRRNQLELRGFAKDLSERTDIRGIIFDEISAYRDAGTDRHAVARHFVKDKAVVWGATGTPTPNKPTDAHGIAKLINNAFGESFTSFRTRTMVQVSMHKWLPARGAAEKARALLSPSIRFGLEDCTDVPESTTQMRDVPLSKEQAQHYDKLKRDAHLLLADGSAVTPANEAVLRMKLIQIACGVVYSGSDSTRKEHRLDCGPRLKELREVIRETGNKALIFAPLTSAVSMLYDELDDWSRELVNGTVSPKRRSEIFRRFQEQDDPHLLIADPGTMSHGLDLFAAKSTIWYGPTDRTEVYLQANRRMRRPGQTSPTAIVQFVSTSIEREIFHRIATNQSLQGVTLSLIRGDQDGYLRR